MTSKIKIKKNNNEVSSIIIDEPKTYNSLSFKNLSDLLNALKKLDADKKVKGQKSRYMCIPAYVLDPWRVNTPEHSKAIYGKVLPIHIERNQARSDGLTD